MTEVTSNVAGADRELIAFRIGEQEFCVDIMNVREIRGWTPATPLPRSPSYMKGVINLRGIVLPIIDLGARFGLATAEPTRLATRAPVERARAITGPISRSRMPAFSTTPPKARAARISQTVTSMLSIPPRVSSWSTAGWPVSDT